MSTTTTHAVCALQAKGLSKAFGGLLVTRDVSLTLRAGARTALIGPNGAGKTTLVNLLSGVTHADAGQLILFDQDITHISSAGRTRAGLVRTFQISSLYAKLTVLENVYIAVTQASGSTFHFWRPAGRRKELIQRCEELIEGLRLQDDCHHPVARIAYGRQRLVEIALALALRPRVLLLDEPAAGIPSTELDLLLRAIDDLPRDIAVLMIEHDMEMVRRFATDISVLVQGAMLMSGSPKQVMNDPEVQAVYLGQSGVRRFEGEGTHA
jgi:branched-chain amino acid transport system ATP-binding protein